MKLELTLHNHILVISADFEVPLKIRVLQKRMSDLDENI